MKTIRILTALSILLLLCSTLGCAADGTPQSTSSTTASHAIPGTSADIAPDTAQDTTATSAASVAPNPKGEEHILLTLHSQTEDGIILGITANYDANLLSYDMWYLLEYQKDGQWLPLHSREDAAPYFGACPVEYYHENPVEGKPLTSQTFCDLTLLSDVTLYSGRYRITKLFNGAEYTVECDLVFDPPLTLPEKTGPVAIPE